MSHRTTRFAALAAALVLASAACTSSNSESDSGAGGSTEATSVGTTSVAPPLESGREVAPIDAGVQIEPGALAAGELTVDGLRVEYVTITPPGFTAGDAAPVLIAFPPGGQDLEVTTSVAARTYEAEAVARGWVVFSPARPDEGDRWYDGSQDLSPALLDWVETWVEPEGGGFHLAGVSNGGLSSFATAVLQPERVNSIITFPGFPRGAETRDLVPLLSTIPVRMFVGETDDGWVEPAQDTFDTLTSLDGDVELDIVEGEGHIIAKLNDGTIIFDELDDIRAGSPDPTDDRTRFDGDWLLTAMSINGIDTQLVAENPITMSIDGTAITGMATCNGYATERLESGDDFRLELVTTTLVMCEDIGIETAYYESLNAAERAEIDAGSLVVTGAGSRLVYAQM